MAASQLRHLKLVRLRIVGGDRVDHGDRPVHLDDLLRGPVGLLAVAVAFAAGTCEWHLMRCRQREVSGKAAVVAPLLAACATKDRSNDGQPLLGAHRSRRGETDAVPGRRDLLWALEGQVVLAER
eukprot:scaffold3496_cov201-Pinguiococcus_pyrenoidosus.AAC.4